MRPYYLMKREIVQKSHLILLRQLKCLENLNIRGGKMVKTVQVSVKVFEVSAECDFSVPLDMLVNDAIALIVDILCKENYPIVNRLKKLRMFDADKATLCKGDMSFAKCGITRGTKLIII